MIYRVKLQKFWMLKSATVFGRGHRCRTLLNLFGSSFHSSEFFVPPVRRLFEGVAYLKDSHHKDKTFWLYNLIYFMSNKVALNPLQRISLNFAKSCILLCLSQLDNKKWGSPSSFFSYKSFKLKLRVFLAGNIVAMVSYCATKLTATSSPMIGQCFDTMSLASTDIEWL